MSEFLKNPYKISPEWQARAVFPRQMLMCDELLKLNQDPVFQSKVQELIKDLFQLAMPYRFPGGGLENAVDDALKNKQLIKEMLKVWKRE